MRSSDNTGLSLERLDTPCLVVGAELLEKNLRLMQAHADKSGKALRPHVKTHKCSALARMQVDCGAVGLCVAKVSEACGLVAAGLRSILITSPVVTEEKITRLLECVKTDPGIMVVVDSAENAKELSRRAVEHGVKIGVLVDIDPGLGRTGVRYDDALEFGRFVHRCDGLTLKGIQCYAGNLQHLESYKERSSRSLGVMRRAGEVFREFKAAGLPCGILTGTGTGTFDIDSLVPEVTELQVGSYALMDAEYSAIGSAAADRFETFAPALRIVTSVISVNHAAEGWVTVDAGLKAIYHHGATPLPLARHAVKLIYDWFGDEHGKLTGRSEDLPALGEKVELMVSHCDPTVNLFDNFYLLRGGKVADVWPIDLRGCCH